MSKKEVYNTPHFDGSGPEGYGSMTGRGMGYCAGFVRRGYRGMHPGRGLAHRHGFHRGYGPGPGYGYVPHYEPEYNREDEVRYLKDTARALEEELEYVRRQLNKLEEPKED